MKNKKIFLFLGAFLFLFLVVGSSYAFWTIVSEQEGKNIVSTSCFKVTLMSQTEGISLQNSFPILDEDGRKLSPYTFTIENVCDTTSHYKVQLETLNSDKKLIPEKYLKASLVHNESEVFFNTLKSRYETTEKGITDSLRAFLLFEGEMNGKTSETFDLRLWIDQSTTLKEEVMNATYLGKIAVVASFVPPISMENMMMTVLNNDDENNFLFFRDSHQIIFENKIQDIAGITPVDISKNHNNSVLAYVDRSDENHIVTHIQANGTILFPEDSSYLLSDFGNLSQIDGLEHVNTSFVTDMSHLFESNSSLTSIDLSGFDVSHVTNMEGMFYDCYNLQDINLSNWKFSSNTDLSDLFYRFHDVNTLNMSHWDVSPFETLNRGSIFDGIGTIRHLDMSNWTLGSVVFDNDFSLSTVFENLDMSGWEVRSGSSLEDYIFNYRIKNLNLSNWDLSGITDLSGFFDSFIENNYLESLNLSNWDITEVTNMKELFSPFPSLTSLNLSGWDTSNVRDMRGMFSGTSSLTEVIYDSKFIYKDGMLITDMYLDSSANTPDHESWSGIF